MKVCLITGEYPPMQGGMGDYTHELGKALAELGIEVSIITSARAKMHDARGKMQETCILHLASCIVHPVIEKWNWRSWRRIIGLLGETCPDILHIQYQTAAYGMHPAINFLPLRLRLLAHRPRVAVTFHDVKVPYLFPKAGRLRWWVNLAIARWSDAVIVTNIADMDRLSAYPFIRSLSVVPIGSNIRPQPPPAYDRQEWRARLGVGPDALLLSYFGFLNESKGAETLVRALDKLVRERSFSLNPLLLMVGGRVGASDPTNVAYLEKVERLIEELGFSERVLWTDYTTQAEVSANLLASDICVLPYRDGASFRRGSFMAALAHGLPIVSTQPRVAIPELMDGANIALAPPDDAEALAEAIAALAASPGLCQRLGAGAKELARSFTWESIAQETVKVYNVLLD